MDSDISTRIAYLKNKISQGEAADLKQAVHRSDFCEDFSESASALRCLWSNIFEFYHLEARHLKVKVSHFVEEAEILTLKLLQGHITPKSQEWSKFVNEFYAFVCETRRGNFNTQWKHLRKEFLEKQPRDLFETHFPSSITDIILFYTIPINLRQKQSNQVQLYLTSKKTHDSPLQLFNNFFFEMGDSKTLLKNWTIIGDGQTGIELIKEEWAPTKRRGPKKLIPYHHLEWAPIGSEDLDLICLWCNKNTSVT